MFQKYVETGKQCNLQPASQSLNKENTSCNFKSIKNVEKDEELFYHYGVGYWLQNEWNQCNLELARALTVFYGIYDIISDDQAEFIDEVTESFTLLSEKTQVFQFAQEFILLLALTRTERLLQIIPAQLKSLTEIDSARKIGHFFTAKIAPSSETKENLFEMNWQMYQEDLLAKKTKKKITTTFCPPLLDVFVLLLQPLEWIKRLPLNRTKNNVLVFPSPCQQFHRSHSMCQQ